MLALLLALAAQDADAGPPPEPPPPAASEPYDSVDGWRVVAPLGARVPAGADCGYTRLLSVTKEGVRFPVAATVVVACVDGARADAPHFKDPPAVPKPKPKPATAAAAPAPRAAPKASEGGPPLVDGGAFYLEEDAFNLFTPSDRNYTGGGALAFSGALFAWPAKGVDVVDALFLQQIYAWLEQSDPDFVHTNDFAFGLTVFTPENLRTAAPIATDRPYSALAFAHVGHTTFSSRATFLPWTQGLAVSSYLNVGMLGTDAGHALQAFIHRTIRGVDQRCTPSNFGTPKPPEPCGWGNQISSGGELTALYGVRAKHLVTEHELVPYVWFDAAATASAEAGYYVDGSVGMDARLGLIRTPFWQANQAPLDSVNMGAKPKHELALPIEFYAWVGGRSRVVGYNALMQGQLRRSAVTVRPEPFIGEFETGLTATAWWLSVTWAPLVARSSDFVGDPEGVHTWTSWFFSVHGAL